jgi:hypothetical protein
MRRYRLVALVVMLGLPSRSAHAQGIDTGAVLGALRDALLACRRDDGALWGRSMCGPIAIADRQSRMVITNDSVMGRPFLQLTDAFVSTAPAGVGFANTAFQWVGRPWAMIMLPLPRDRFDRLALVMHEVFHREQAALGLGGGDPPNNPLDQRDGRRWLRLELNALAMALDTLDADERAARMHASSAMLFRAQRHALYPTSDSLEVALELQEGLAEYSGVAIAMRTLSEPPRRIARRVREFQSSPTYVRSFAYATGPALGVLLDRFSPTWRRDLLTTKDPALLLARAVAFVPPRDLARTAELSARRYEVATIDREEAARDSTRRAPMAAYRARLVGGPTLQLDVTNLSRNFDPNSLIGFDMMNTLYPTGTFGGEWGSIEVTGGILVSNDMRRLQVGAPSALPAAGESVVRGDGWVLTLKPGWSVVLSPDRPGSFVVRASSLR